MKFFFTSKLEKATAKHEYEQMLRCILEYELRSSSVARYWWAGKLTSEGEAILQQYTKCANGQDGNRGRGYSISFVKVTVRMIDGVLGW